VGENLCWEGFVWILRIFCVHASRSGAVLMLGKETVVPGGAGAAYIAENIQIFVCIVVIFYTIL